MSFFFPIFYAWEGFAEYDTESFFSSFTATLFQKLPNLKLAIPESEIKYSPPKKDVGITELPIVF